MPTSGIILGRNVKLLWGGTAVENLTSLSLSGSRNTIDITSYDSATFAEFEPGTQNYSISGTMFVAFDATEGYDEMMDDMLAGTKQTALITTTVTGDTTLSATGFVSSIEPSGDLDGGYQANFTIQLTGTVTKGVVS